MIVPDINLLVFAHNDRAPHHRAARRWWEECLNGLTPVGLPWIVAGGFIRLMTHPRILASPLPPSGAVAHVRAWLHQPPVRILHPGGRFEDLFFGYLEEVGAAGNLTTDAHIAALTVEHQATLHSNDVDFARFPGLRWHNPIGK